MKIGYIFTDWKGVVLQSAGGSVHIQEIVRALCELGHEVFVLAAKKGDEETSWPKAPTIYEIKPQLPLLPFAGGSQQVLSHLQSKNPGFPTGKKGEIVSTTWTPRSVWRDVTRAVWARLWDQHFYRQARQIIKAEQPDALYERYVPDSSAGTRLAQEFGLPLILEMNTSLTFPSEWWHRHSPLYPFLIRRAEQDICTRAARIIVVSSRLEKYLLGLGIPRQKIEIMHNGADPERFKPNAAHTAQLREKCGLGQNLVVGFIGSLRPWHDLDLLLDCAPLVLERYRAVRFLIVGDGPLRARLEERVRSEGLSEYVTFTGFVSRQEAPAYINSMDIALALSPRSPDFHFSPLKMFEYMAAAKPVIASRHLDIEAVISNGHNGVLVEPGDKVLLAEAIVTLLQDQALREQLGLRARQKVCENYTWKGNAQRTLQLYEEIQTARAGRRQSEAFSQPDWDSRKLL
jgi:glycosyltransferase involved in cell wall biosynthesis